MLMMFHSYVSKVLPMLLFLLGLLSTTIITHHAVVVKAQVVIDDDDPSSSSSPFVVQSLGIPFDGYHSGVAVIDLNGDGHPDLLFSAGRHNLDQSFAYINLGRTEQEEDGTNTDTEEGKNSVIRWSEALQVGPVGGYYQVDAFSGLATLEEGHTAVLLAGGGGFAIGTIPARLLDVHVTGCITQYDDDDDDSSFVISNDNNDSSSTSSSSNCTLEWTQIWEDPYPQGDRNGALAPTITNLVTEDPAIVLTSSACTAIFLPDTTTGLYPETATYILTPDQKDPSDPEGDGNVNRAAGLAVGYVGTLPGIVVGARTQGTFAPAPPLVGIVQKIVNNIDDGTGNDFEFDHFVIDEGTDYTMNDDDEDPTGSSATYAFQPTGVVLDDWNGDGITDIGVANFLSSSSISDPNDTIPHWYYELLSDNKSSTGGISNDNSAAEDDIIPYNISRRVALMTTGVGGRSIDSGILFPERIQAGIATNGDSRRRLPDMVIGSAESSIHFLANLGINETDGTSLGFEELYSYELPGNCQIRDLVVAELKPCHISVICAVNCFNTAGGDQDLLGNYIFYSKTPHCQTTGGNNNTTTPTAAPPTQQPPTQPPTVESMMGGSDCGELFSDCVTDDDCCDDGVCLRRQLNRPKVCSSVFVRSRANKQTVGNRNRGGFAGRVKGAGGGGRQ